MAIYNNSELILSPDVRKWKEKLQLLAMTDLFAFSHIVLEHKLLVKRVHHPFCQFLTDSFLDAVVFPKMIEKGIPLPTNPIYHPKSMRRRRKLLLSTRDSYKTTLATRSLPLWILTHDPNASILICSEIKDNAKDLLGEIKKQIEGNVLFRALYGDWKSDEHWQAESITIKPRTRPQSEPSIRVSGTTSSTVGTHWDYIICDDLHSLSNVHNKEAIGSIIEYFSDIKAQIKENGFLYIVGTRYNLSDLYSHIITNFSDQYDILEQYATLPDGSFWFPEHISQKYLDDRRPHTQRETEIYNAFYYGNLSPIGESKLDITKIKFFDGVNFDKPPLKDINLYCIIDPASSKKQDSSNTAIIIGGMDCEENVYLVDTIFGHWSPDEVEVKAIDTIRLYYKWLKGVHPEEVALSSYFTESLRKAMIKNNLRTALEAVKPRGLSKADRILKIDGLEKCINEGKFYCRRGLNDFLGEAEFFPKSPTMDIVDAVAYLFYVAKPPQRKVVEPTAIEEQWKRLDEWTNKKLNPPDEIRYDPVLGQIVVR